VRRAAPTPGVGSATAAAAASSRDVSHPSKPPAAIAQAQRWAFSFSRDLEFATEPELVKRMGCVRQLWLCAAVKELSDNGLDAAEEAGVEPVITVAMDSDTLTATDNGPGMAPELVA
jgi:hypothetical protein